MTLLATKKLLEATRLAITVAPEIGAPLARSRIVPVIVPPVGSATLAVRSTFALTVTGVAVVRSLAFTSGFE